MESKILFLFAFRENLIVDNYIILGQYLSNYLKEKQSIFIDICLKRT
jgi:hypothetical protein